ncbi:hypothetical protein A3C09_00735 [Candidatus Uhrbacteria bacterium RIFCSPHIGHO2_02_FULL_47_44]|uniref:Uncharacterized protein n=1 Tax=Candidatus Uhrbacteria bacterium RIFCSPLOWO2_02_FULL_48_18 TaxID=1802408 RepID=A0A1F7VAM6_9BACT|nr:MAG: hypothetical protein A2839_02510 [Candidatus Uhrbacteria bacterium RIFCSPHIGHO2_01_FULL_47_10]OGL69713.1 MAG: hypothetical protein A3C09_00735 [Candidatus Uhrbacteria bacterium RIFCSPHIGHO2_02_FULL_47_44]OGL77479.1 MAG: hypothetical protein A3E97_00680 [Candidatus Uhrbacteria bacterium RIFCSPHIGHO2_12_FULL_47_12]OGL81841.1 MAG: hypothetical protein A3B20_01985 [Candidatus Uhrbacteria bacterium RIFCSPLOWO2_01_FULL_47_17]OGL87004.1 MAG: hypothetical protein A3I41_03575 [Candidatus Uhrbact
MWIFFVFLANNLGLIYSLINLFSKDKTKNSMSEFRRSEGRDVVMHKKVQSLAPGESSKEERELAAELVRRELIDFYQKFDPNYFYSDEQETGKQLYEQILQNSALVSVLAGEASVGTLGDEVWDMLQELTRKEQKFGDVLSKGNTLDDLEPLLEAAQISALSPDRRAYVGGRTVNHFYRFLFPQKYDRKLAHFDQENLHAVPASFAKDFLQYVATMEEPNEEDADKISHMMSTEGSDVFVFWTLAPYMHDELMREGHDAKQSMERIFDWIREGFDRQQAGENYVCHFPAAEFVRTRDRFSVLGYDERMPSHLLARLNAKKVIEHLE